MPGLEKRVKARIFQASTSEVYGDACIHPQKEDYSGNVNPLGPRACYDESKRGAETLFMDYRRLHGLSMKVARIFNTYGPRMHPNDGLVVSNFMMQALAGEPITVYGDGSQTRSLCYVDDMVDAFVRLMSTPEDVTGPINLGSPHELSMLEIARRIVELAGSSSTVVFAPLPVDDPNQRQPDIACARSALDWRPTTYLDDGLRRTPDYFRGFQHGSEVRASVCLTT
jgi:UDP-glucuronate decarboxylase